MFRITIRSIDQTKADAVRAAKQLAASMTAPDPVFQKAAWRLARTLEPVAFDPLGYFLNPATYLAYKDEPVAWFWKHRNAKYMRSQAELDKAMAMEILSNSQDPSGRIGHMRQSLGGIIVAAIKKGVSPPTAAVAAHRATSAREWIYKLLTEIAYPCVPPPACYTAPWVHLCASSVLILDDWRSFFESMPTTGDRVAKVPASKNSHPQAARCRRSAKTCSSPTGLPAHLMMLLTAGDGHSVKRDAFRKAIDGFNKNPEEARKAILLYAEQIVTDRNAIDEITKLAGNSDHADTQLRALVTGACTDEREMVAEVLAALTWRRCSRWKNWTPNVAHVQGQQLATEVSKLTMKSKYSSHFLESLRTCTLTALDLQRWGKTPLNALKDLLDFLAESTHAKSWRLAVVGTSDCIGSALHEVDNALLRDGRSIHLQIPQLRRRPEDAKRILVDILKQTRKECQPVEWKNGALEQLYNWRGLTSINMLRRLASKVAASLKPGAASVTKKCMKNAIIEVQDAFHTAGGVAQLEPGEPEVKGVLLDGKHQTETRPPQKDAMKNATAGIAGYLPSSLLAKKHGLNHDPLRKRLDRLRLANQDLAVEKANRSNREPKWLYPEDDLLVQGVLDALKASNRLSSTK